MGPVWALSGAAMAGPRGVWARIPVWLALFACCCISGAAGFAAPLGLSSLGHFSKSGFAPPIPFLRPPADQRGRRGEAWGAKDSLKAQRLRSRLTSTSGGNSGGVSKPVLIFDVMVRLLSQGQHSSPRGHVLGLSETRISSHNPRPHFDIRRPAQSTLVFDAYLEIPAFLGMQQEDLWSAKDPEAWLSFERGECSEEEFIRNFFLDRREWDARGMMDMLYDGYSWLPGMEDLLCSLGQQGYQMHVLSNYVRKRVSDQTHMLSLSPSHIVLVLVLVLILLPDSFRVSL